MDEGDVVTGESADTSRSDGETATTNEGKSLNLPKPIVCGDTPCGSHSISGSRTYNEDRICIITDLLKGRISDTSVPSEAVKALYVAVYDGHNGESAVDFIVENLYKYICTSICEEAAGISAALQNGFRHADNELLKHVLENSCTVDEHLSQFSSGATACVCLLTNSALFVANIGDSRCIVSRGGRSALITTDHRSHNKDERRRVLQLNGHLDQDGYLGGVLGVTRAFGNFKSNGEKLPGLSSDPEVFCVHLLPEDEFIVVACDGIFDVMGCQEVVSTIRSSLRNGADADEATKHLCELASRRHSFDNLSAALIIIKPPAPLLSTAHPERRRFNFSPLNAVIS